MERKEKFFFKEIINQKNYYIFIKKWIKINKSKIIYLFISLLKKLIKFFILNIK
jgi:hypothetical protein